MDLVVINLMRLGDLIQTSPVVRGLRAKYPEGKITLAVMDLFQETASLLPGVDRLLTFPSASLATLLDQEGGWPEAAQRLAEWLKGNFPQPPDLVVNLTPNRLGAFLAFATGAPEIRGMFVDPSLDLATQPAWASYALIVSRARQANPFNLVDLFLGEAGLPPDGKGLEVQVPGAAIREVQRFLSTLNLPPETALVGMFPGASQPERCWPPEYFARAAALLLRNQACHFLLFGSAGEAPRGEAISRGLPASATTLFFGRTSPAVLAAYLKHLDLLVTNDTGPMHLAAGVGTPTLALFLASARVQDTGPVGRGHVILEPRLDCHPCLTACPQPHCHQAITPEAVSFWANQLLKRGPLTPGEESGPERKVRVYLAETDPQGYHAFLPLVRQPLNRQDFWLWLHRLVWGQALEGPEFPGALLRQWLDDILCRHYLPPRGDLEVPIGQSYLKELCRTASQGEELARQIASLAEKGQEAAVRMWQKIEALQGVDQGLRRLGVAFPELAAFMEFYFQEQRMKHGSEADLLAKELLEAYTRLRWLGELGLARLAELKANLGLEAGAGPCPELAQAVQETLSNSEALQPESEGSPCR